MSRSNFLWGLGGMIVGAIGTYFVMEYIYEKEIGAIYDEIDKAQIDNVESANEALDHIKQILTVEEMNEAKDKLIPPTSDAPFTISNKDGTRFNPDANDGQDEFDPTLPVESLEENMEVDEAIALQLIHEQEILEGEDEEDDSEMPVQNAFNSIYIIPNDEVSTRQVVGEFNHEDCTVEISKLMSVKTEMFDEVIDGDELFTLIGEEAYNILFNTEPGKKKNVLAVRNNQINLDFVITY